MFKLDVEKVENILLLYLLEYCQLSSNYSSMYEVLVLRRKYVDAKNVVGAHIVTVWYCVPLPVVVIRKLVDIVCSFVVLVCSCTMER